MAEKRIAFIGDVHCNLPALYKFADKNEVDAIVQVGDFGLYFSEEAVCKKELRRNFHKVRSTIKDLTTKSLEKFPVPVYFIIGNHEDFDNVEHPYLQELNIYYLRQARIHDILGFNIAVLGGIWSPIKYNWAENRLHGRNKRFYTSAQLEELIIRSKYEDIDVLVTHQAAAGLIHTRENYHDEGNTHLRRLVESLNPKHYVFGHHHITYKEFIGDTQVHGLSNFSKNNQAFAILA